MPTVPSRAELHIAMRLPHPAPDTRLPSARTSNKPVRSATSPTKSAVLDRRVALQERVFSLLPWREHVLACDYRVALGPVYREGCGCREPALCLLGKSRRENGRVEIDYECRECVGR